MRKLDRELPRLWLLEDELAMTDREPDGLRLVWQEEWIYFPSTAVS